MNWHNAAKWLRGPLLLCVLLGFFSCLSFRDLEGFPCPSTGECPAHLTCRVGVCIDPATQSEPPLPDAAPKDQKAPTEHPTDAQPGERPVPPEGKQEPQPEPIVPEFVSETGPEMSPERASPEPPMPDDAGPPQPLQFQIDKLFDATTRRLWGIATTPISKGLTIVGQKDTPGGVAGVMVKGPSYSKAWHWEQSYTTQRGLFDILMISNTIFLAVGESRQKGIRPENGPILRSTMSAATASWREVALSEPDALGEKAALYRLAKSGTGGQDPILAVGTTDTTASQGVGLVMESRDQGTTWQKLTLPRHNATTFRDAVFFPNNRGAVVIGDNNSIFSGSIVSKHLLWQGMGPTIRGDHRAIAVVPPSDLALSVTKADGTHYLQYYDGRTFRWTAATHPRALARINGLAFANGLGLAVGDGGAILRSLDRGRSWQAIPSPTTKHLHRVSFHDKRVYISGDQVILSADVASP